jgi:hypothetical protein
MSYLGRSAKLSLKAQEKVSFLATAGQTSKTGLSYTPSFVEVYVNGVLLTDTTDYTATNGNSVTFTVALLLNDEVTVISLKTFTVADHYNKTEADTLLAAKATIANFTSTGIDDNATSTAVTIDASENVGIGVTPETWQSGWSALQIGGLTSYYAPTTTNASQSLMINNNAYNDGAWKYLITDEASSYFQWNGGHTFRVAPSGTADSAISWTTGFEVLADGKARAKNGLLFGTDTAAANALDDYEEGTWTFAMTGSTGSVGSYTQAGAVGTYTKIGDMVYFNGTSYVSDKGSYTGNLIIEGLPFASNASTNVAASVSGLPISAFGANVYGALINANNTFITFRKGLYLDDTAAWSELTPNVRVYVSGSYKIA